MSDLGSSFNDLKPNSYKYKDAIKKEEKSMEKVTTGNVRRKKKSGLSKTLGAFIAEDVSNLKEYIIMDVVVPELKRAAIDVIQMIFYGERGMSKKTSTADRFSYQKYYDKERGSNNGRTIRSRRDYEYDDLIVDTYGEAIDILSRLDEAIESYGIATVADLYELAGITPDHTDNSYGWNNLASADAVPVRGGGYLLKLPKARPIER